MSSPIDVAFCVDYTPSMAPGFDCVKNVIFGIVDTALTSWPNGSRFSLIKFRSYNDHQVTTTHPFTQCKNTFKQWLDCDQPEGGSEGGFKAVVDALREAVNLDWRENGVNGIFQEKLVILITDYVSSNIVTPLVGERPLSMGKEFAKKDIVLVVVDAESNVVKLDDFYSALTRDTRGAYIPLINAESIFSSVIKMAIEEADTLHQALARVMGRQDHPMIDNCETMTDIQSVFDDYHIHHFS